MSDILDTSTSWAYAYSVAVVHGEKDPGAKRFANWYTADNKVYWWVDVTPNEAWEIYTYEH